MNEEKKTSYIFFSVLIAFVFSLLVARLFYLQIIKGDQFYQFSLGNAFREISLRAPRGKIYDRNGVLLATNQAVHQIIVNRHLVKNKDALIKTLAYLLDWKEERIKKKYKPDPLLPNFYPQLIANHLTYDEVIHIRAKISQIQFEDSNYDLSGIELVNGHERYYPMGEEWGHLLGYVRQANPKALADLKSKNQGPIVLGDLVGITGVERQFDEQLRGQNGFRQIIVDARGREVQKADELLKENLQTQSFTQGADLVLSIDARLQDLAYKAFGNRSGSLVALDPKTGEVLALVSNPSYHPSQLTGRISPENWKILKDHPRNILLNRSIQGQYPPGSTYKIVTAIAALAEGVITTRQTITCNGALKFGSRSWGCWNKAGHGPVDLYGAIKGSCDVYFYKLGLKLGVDRLAKYARLFGLGEKTGLFDLGEKPGLIPTKEWKLKNRKEEWSESENLGISIGQGTNLLTPLQSALMIAEFSNGGYQIHPRLTKFTGDRETELKSFTKIPWGINSAQYKRIHQALVAVVEESGGTGKQSRIPGIQVAGKTGTAQVVSLNSRVNKEDHAWFVAYAPAENPKIALAVIVEHGGHGGGAAAPIAKVVMEDYLTRK